MNYMAMLMILEIPALMKQFQKELVKYQTNIFTTESQMGQTSISSEENEQLRKSFWSYDLAANRKEVIVGTCKNG